MDQTQLTLLALLLGAVIGGGVSGLIFYAFRLRDRAIARTSDDVPSGVSAILAAMDDDASVTIAAS